MISPSIYKTHNEAPLFSCQETKDTCLLVVDDNDLDRMRVRRLLDDRYRVVEADTDLCAEALLLLHRPDCVLLDYPIAGMDTLTFVETCAHYHIPVVMLTEGVHDDTIEAQQMQRRAHDWLPKAHVTKAALGRTVMNAVEKGTLTPYPDADGDHPVCKSPFTAVTIPKLLIVDDDEPLVAALKRSFRSHGYHVRAVHDAAMTWPLARTYQPHLILLDIKLPFQDGWCVADQLRDAVETAHIPFIILTGIADPDLQAKAQAHEAFACFEKPCEQRDLLAAITAAVG